MCPACIGSALTLVVGATSAGVAACLAFWRVKVRCAARTETSAAGQQCSQCTHWAGDIAIAGRLKGSGGNGMFEAASSSTRASAAASDCSSRSPPNSSLPE